ncbi:MAG: aminoglycoside phosphotransferase family protein, partial [Salinisphaera sp.]|nr:aminoglycoside phosphotransferase family protein [Salinisphaera sp.]
ANGLIMTESQDTAADRLHRALYRAGWDVAPDAIRPMPDKGLAHDHWWIGSGSAALVARIPKQSQMNLAAADNLAYQAACFRRAGRGGCTPSLHAVLPPDTDLPRGGLLVSAIEGRAARLPVDLPAVARALASLHALPLPPVAQRPPLQDPKGPWSALLGEILAQAEHIPQAGLTVGTRQRIAAEIKRLRVAIDHRPPDTKTLISFDAHPGNFLVTPDGRAILVDLEKCRYGLPGADLAHATLYTSTTWDVDSYAELDVLTISRFYGAWAEAMGASGAGEQIDEGALLQARRGMWLWSVTWCAKWRALHAGERDAQASGEDWSAALSDDGLIRHVADRVDHYLSPPVVGQVIDEWDALSQHPLGRPVRTID